jgi:hypothetical protein
MTKITPEHLARGLEPPRPSRVQAPPDPPGVKITRKAFGRDRRYPITNAFRKLGLS